MSPAVAKLLAKLSELDDLLDEEIADARSRFHYRLEKNRILFEEHILGTHRDLRVRLPRFLKQSGVLSVVAAPMVYGLIVPLVLLDIAVVLFQAACFPVYGIVKVKRSEYIVVDRHRLAYLNGVEKLNCAYCGYANGLIAFVNEIASRAEEHWCPIKHARKVRPPHRRYYGFAEYGDAEGYFKRRTARRNDRINRMT